MKGYCEGCGEKEVRIKKIEGGSVGHIHLCKSCYNDMLNNPFVPF